MRAEELSPAHYGWHVKADYAEGILRVVLREEGKVKLIVENLSGKGIQGIALDRNQEVFAEKRLEDQIKDDLNVIKAQALGWVRKKFNGIL